MIINPPIDDLMKKVDSKYTLVVATAKRAREIQKTGIAFAECDSDKPVTIAINEINENKVTFAGPDQDKVNIDNKLLQMFADNDKDLVGDLK